MFAIEILLVDMIFWGFRQVLHGMLTKNGQVGRVGKFPY